MTSDSSSMVSRKPARRKVASKSTSARKTPAKKVVKPTPPKSVPGSKQSHTARLRAAGQELGLIEKATPKIQEAPVTISEKAKAIAASYGVGTLGKQVSVLTVPWEERAVATALGAEWNSMIREFLYTGTIIPQGLHKYRTEDYTLARWIEDEINRKIKMPARTAPMVPRKHQITAIEAIKKASSSGWRGFIEADSTGLGKSLSSLQGVSEAAALKGFTPQRKAKLLIVCPKAVIPHWRQTINASGIKNLRIMVVNYEQAPKLLSVPDSAASAKTARTKNKRVAASGKPLVLWDYIIADEAHKLKNAQTAQTPKVFSQIARYSAESTKSPFVVWASATIGQNPLELAYLSPIIGQAVKKKLMLKNWGEYLEQNGYHVTPGKVGYTWVTIASKDTPSVVAQKRAEQLEDIKKLSSILFAPSFPSIRRTPEDIAGWPKINRIALPIELSVNQKLLYDEAWLEFRNYVKLHPYGKDPQGGLAAELRFRQKASFLRASNTVELIQDLLDNKNQVAVYVEFLETLDQIKSRLGNMRVAEFSGRNLDARDDERLAFQKGEAKVILFTAKEGISLHAEEQLPDGSFATKNERALLIHDQKYSSIQATQIEGRTSRDGKSANTYHIYAEGTVEKKITKNMLTKMENMKTLSGDDSSLIEEIQNLLN